MGLQEEDLRVQIAALHDQLSRVLEERDMYEQRLADVTTESLPYKAQVQLMLNI